MMHVDKNNLKNDYSFERKINQVNGTRCNLQCDVNIVVFF